MDAIHHTHREIKFRVWDKTYNKMYLEGICVYGDGSFDIQRTGEDGHAIETAESESGELVLSQYTGLKDKNRREIYEGDIVKWGHIEGGIECPVRIAEVRIGGQVEFVSRQKEVVRRGDDEYRFGYGSFAYKDTYRWLEVIGNIYENPELLQP